MTSKGTSSPEEVGQHCEDELCWSSRAGCEHGAGILKMDEFRFCNLVIVVGRHEALMTVPARELNGPG